MYVTVYLAVSLPCSVKSAELGQGCSYIIHSALVWSLQEFEAYVGARCILQSLLTKGISHHDTCSCQGLRCRVKRAYPEPPLRRRLTNYSLQCVVANLDADAAQNKPLAEKYGVQSYPTLKFFAKGKKGLFLCLLHCVLPDAHVYDLRLDAPVDYDGPRSEEAFVEFLNEKCGTQRTVGGGLTDLVRTLDFLPVLSPVLISVIVQAGRLPDLDKLASQFFAATGAARDEIYKDATALAEKVGPVAKQYVRVMEKVVNGSEEYVEKESKR